MAPRRGSRQPTTRNAVGCAETGVTRINSVTASGQCDPEADLIGSTEKGPAIENILRYAVLLGAVGVSIVACGGLLGGRIGAFLRHRPRHDGRGGSGGSRIDS